MCAETVPGAAAEYMESALSLAKLATGSTSPNPAVGAVIVKEGEVVGMGYTQPAGLEHAEIVALRQAGERAQGATLYVSLEPCCHYGRTPPCTRAIIEAGISQVYIALEDPNPRVAGRGIQELEESGIATHVGICKDHAYQVNEAYCKFITTGVPFVTAKFAMSLDGKLATKTGHSRWISNEESRKYVHMLRHSSDVIMVGVNTVIRDNPLLTARCSCGKGGTAKTQPLRLVVDSNGRTPVEAAMFGQPGRTMIATVEPLDREKRSRFNERGIEFFELPSSEGRVDLSELLAALGKLDIVTVLVEGGSQLLGSLFDHGLVDKVVAFISPIIIGGEGAKSPVGGNGAATLPEALHLERVDFKVCGNNVLASGYTRQMAV
jgi:diaminohydroxyphosphoribosylaminopyrimidine deaminase/5-amino-6-(5-phosphoribosylamino)uracil reductase